MKKTKKPDVLIVLKTVNYDLCYQNNKNANDYGTDKVLSYMRWWILVILLLLLRFEIEYSCPEKNSF